jgi:hypothetical protein
MAKKFKIIGKNIVVVQQNNIGGKCLWQPSNLNTTKAHTLLSGSADRYFIFKNSSSFNT